MKPRIVCMLRKETKLIPFLPTKTAKVNKKCFTDLSLMEVNFEAFFKKD